MLKDLLNMLTFKWFYLHMEMLRAGIFSPPDLNFQFVKNVSEENWNSCSTRTYFWNDFSFILKLDPNSFHMRSEKLDPCWFYYIQKIGI